MRLLKYFIFLFIMIVIPLKVDASTVRFNCPTSVRQGDTIICTIPGGAGITSFSAEVSVTPAEAVYNRTVAFNGFAPESINTTTLSFTRASGGASGDVARVELSVPASFPAGESVTINLNNIHFSVDSVQLNLTNQTRTVNIQPRTTTTTTTTTRATTSTTQPSEETTTTTRANNSTTTTTTRAITIEEPNPNETLYLESLNIAEHNLEFSRFVFEYPFKVLYDISSLTITATAAKENVIPLIDEVTASNLQVGINIIPIVLKEGDIETTYKLIVTRLAEGEALESNDATLKKLSITGYTINFVPDKLSYELEIGPRVDNLKFDIEQNNENAVWSIQGNSNLKNGSIINIVVTAEDGTELIYKINIVAPSFIEENLIYLIAGGIIVICTITIIIRKKARKKKTHKQATELGTMIVPETTPNVEPDILPVTKTFNT